MHRKSEFEFSYFLRAAVHPAADNRKHFFGTMKKWVVRIKGHMIMCLRGWYFTFFMHQKIFRNYMHQPNSKSAMLSTLMDGLLSIGKQHSMIFLKKVIMHRKSDFQHCYLLNARNHIFGIANKSNIRIEIPMRIRLCQIIFYSICVPEDLLIYYMHKRNIKSS